MPRNDPLTAAAPSGHLRVGGGDDVALAPKAKAKSKAKAKANAKTEVKPPKAKTAVQEATNVSCLDFIVLSLKW